MRTLNTLTTLATAAALAVPGMAFGHDFWIAPDRYRLEPGTTIGVGLEVGDDFSGERVRRRADHLLRFEAFGPGDTRLPIPGELGEDPAGRFAPTIPGAWRLVYESRANRHRMTPQRFAGYLREEGLDRLVEPALAAAAKREGPIRESYYRSVQAIVQVGEPLERGSASVGLERPVGLPLEILALADPRTSPLAQTLSFRVLFRGEPLAGALVTARAATLPALAPSARTDEGGYVDLRLPSPGAWLVKTVHMEESSDPETDWSSWWAALTFDRDGG